LSNSFSITAGLLPAAVTANSTNIVNGSIVDADINASAAIAVSKLAAGGTLSGATGTTPAITLTNTSLTGFARGVEGTTSSGSGSGVMGSTSAAASFASFPGPSAPASATTTTAGVLGVGGGSNTAGLYGFSNGGGVGAVGIDGSATGSGSAGVRGVSGNGGGFGVIGINDSTSTAATAVRGQSSRGVAGVSALATAGSNATQASRLQAGGIYGETLAADGNAGFFKGRVVIENTFAAGATTNDQGAGSPDALVVWTNSGASGFNRSGAMFQVSDRNAKSDFTLIDTSDVLAKVISVPVTKWHYKSDKSTWYMGPMAQDFKSAFDLGDKDTVIHGVNADGVAFAAIQGLNMKLEGEVKARDSKIQDLEARMAAMEQLMLQRTSPSLAGAGIGFAMAAGPLAAVGIMIGLKRRRKLAGQTK